jgi:NADP-dependent alcohol dehydrogenase
MKNFTFHNTTKIIFGRDQIPEIVNEIPKDNKVMIIYGGGSVKRNGTLEKVRGSLKDHTIYEFGGVEANPHYETLMQAVALVKDKGVDFLLALGGDRLLTAPNLSQRLRDLDPPFPDSFCILS